METKVANVQEEKPPEAVDLFAEIGSKVAQELGHETEEDASSGEDAQDEAAGQEGDSAADRDADAEAGSEKDQEQKEGDTAEQATGPERLDAELEEIKSLMAEYNYPGTFAEFVGGLANHYDATSKVAAKPAQQQQQEQETSAEPTKDLKALMAEIEDEDPAVVSEKKITLLMEEVSKLQQTTSGITSNAESVKKAETQRQWDRFEGNFDDAIGGIGMGALFGGGASKKMSKRSAEFQNRKKVYSEVTAKVHANGEFPSNAALKKMVLQEAHGLFFDDLKKTDNKTLGEKLDRRAAQGQIKGDHEVGGKADARSEAESKIAAAREKWKKG